MKRDLINVVGCISEELLVLRTILWSLKFETTKRLNLPDVSELVVPLYEELR